MSFESDDDDDDDEVVVILYFLWNNFINFTGDNTTITRRYWVHPLNSKRIECDSINKFFDELTLDEIKFKNFTRMEIKTFYELLDLIKIHITKNDTNFRKSISAKERLLVTLRYLATGGSLKKLHYQFGIGESTINKIIFETCKIIWHCLLPIVIPPPDTTKWILIAEKFQNIWNFPNCIGAIAEKHIHIKCPPNLISEFKNYNKKFNSIIILQALVDSDGKFIYIEICDNDDYEGKNIFNKSEFGKSFKNKTLNIPASQKIQHSISNNYEFPFVIVGNESFPLMKNLMKPYKKSLTPDKRIFNYRLSRARRLIECTFRMISKKFRILENEMLLHPDKVSIIVMAICSLHNFIKIRDKSYFSNENTSNDFEENVIVVDEDDGKCCSNSKPTNTALHVRTKFTEYFNSPEGSVPWQQKYI